MEDNLNTFDKVFDSIQIDCINELCYKDEITVADVFTLTFKSITNIISNAKLEDFLVRLFSNRVDEKTLNTFNIVSSIAHEQSSDDYI